MWSPSESSNTDVSKDRRTLQRPRHQALRRPSASNLVDSSSRQKDFRYDREDIYSSTAASTSAAVLSPPRRSLSYEDSLSAMASAPLTAPNTPIPSPSTLRTQRPLGSKRSNLAASSTPASPSVPSPTSRFIAQSNADSTHGPALRSPMFSEPSASRRPSGSASANLAPSRRSSAARSPDAAAAAAALAASKYDMKRMLSKPAPMGASSFGSSSAGSAGLLSAASRTEDDAFHHQPPQQQQQQHQDIDPLAYSSSYDTSRSYLKNVNPDLWPSDAPGLGTGAGGKSFPDSVVGAPASTSNSTATRTRSRNESSTSSSAAALPASAALQSQSRSSQYHPPSSASSSSRNQPHRAARALTQASSTTNSSSIAFPQPGASSSTASRSNTSYFADYSVDSHSQNSSSSRIPPMPGVAFPISDDVGGSFLSGPGSGAAARKSSSSGPPRALTPASAIAYAYQQQQQLRGGGGGGGVRDFDSTRPSPSPSPNPSFYTASSSSASESGRVYGGGESEYYQHQQQQQQYLNTPFGSSRTLTGSPISPTSGRVVSNGDPESAALANGERTKASGALRTLGRKVSGKFSRKSSTGATTTASGRRGTIAVGAEDVINVGGVGSSVSTNEGSFLAMSSEFGGYDGDDSTGGGGVGSAPGMAFSASSSSRGGSGRSRSQYDVSQRRSPSGYFGDASGAGYADVSSSSIDGSLPTSPVSPPIQQQQSTSNSHHRPSKLTKTKSLLRLSQQTRSVTDPTPVAVQEPPTPSSAGVGTSIWRMVKKFSSSTLREKHRAGSSPVEPVPPVPSLPPGVVSSGDVSRRSSVSDHDYGVVVGGGSNAFGAAFGRDEGGGRYSISSAVSKPKSEAKRSVIGRSRSGTVVSSAQSHGHGIPIQNRGGGPLPELPRSGPRSPKHVHNRSLSQSRTTATLSSSPISSDLSSSKYFFGRQQSSPRTSTSSYLAYSDVQDFGPPPPLPVSQKQQQAPPQHIIPPDDLYAAMMKEYGDDLGGVGSAKEDDDASSSNYHNPYSSAASRKSVASSAAPQKGSGLSAPPSRRSTDRSRSRDPPSSRKSSTSGKGDPPSGSGDLRGRNPMASVSSSSLSMAPAKPTKPKKVGNFQHPPLNMLRSRGDNPAALRYVAVQGGGEISPQSAGAKTSPAKKTVFHRLMKSKSEVNLQPPPSTANPPTPPTARPPPPPTATAAAEPKERRRTSPPIPSPSSPTKRWSIDERRGSAGSGNLLNPPSAPLSPARAASFDLQRSRPPSLSTTVMFRDLKEAPAAKRSEDEKNKMWDMLLEKSDKAGGTLHAKIDSSFY